MKNLMAIQAGVSFAALACLLVGWIQPFSPELNNIIYNQLFYILVGASFVLQAPTLANPKFKIPMYIAAGLCIVGAFLPVETKLSGIKTIGLIAGVIMSLFGRNRNAQQ
ncbi:MAG: hypothetical protein ACRC0E_05530 [Soonwooa sp.]